MSIPLPDPPADNPVFGSTKREILLILKREGQSDLQTLAERVHQLTGLRDREGYMAEDHQAGPAKFEILEHNCPILAVAESYWEACTVENELFRKVLDANVETTHRVVAGENVCRFLVTPRRRTPG